MQRLTVMRTRPLLVSVFSILALTGTTTAAAAPQTCGPTFPTRHAYARAIGYDGVTRWTTPLTLAQGADGSTLPPLVDGAISYVAQDGYLTALATADGRRLWQAKPGGSLYNIWRYRNLLAVLADQVGNHATVTGYVAATGAVRWRYRIPGLGLYNTIAQTTGGALAWIRGDGLLQTLDLGTGKLRWSVRVGKNEAQLQFHGAVVSTTGGVVLFAGNGALAAYNEHTGKRLWRTPRLPEQPQLAVSAGVVAMTSGNTGKVPPRVVGVDLVTGRQLWQRRLPTTYGLTLTGTTAGFLVIGGAYPAFREYQLATHTGKTRWSAPAQLLPQVTGAQAIVGNDLLQVTFSYDLYRKYTLHDRDLRTGHQRWQVALHGAPARAGLVAASPTQVYLLGPANGSNPKGEVYAYALTTGQPLWTAKAPTWLGVPPAFGPDGLLLAEVDPGNACPV
jgi:outer membrane protein assembly factor BamB